MDDLLTTKQLQDLLRIDRITIYRMLKDGRLRGFKVGGQWRFSHREIEAWLQEQQVRRGWTPALDLPTEGPASLSQMLPTGCIRAIQAVCAEAMGVSLVTTAMDGMPLSGVSNSCGFCTLILSTQAGRQRCASSWRQQPHGEIKTCHAGLWCASFAIAIGGQRVALANACQFTTQVPGGAGRTWQPPLSELAAGLGLAEADLEAAKDTVRTIPENHVSRISELVRRVAETFSEIGQERLELLGRLEKIAEMSKL